MDDPNEGNPFEQETDEQRHRRIGEMIRENADRRLRIQPSPNILALAPLSDIERATRDLMHRLHSTLDEELCRFQRAMGLDEPLHRAATRLVYNRTAETIFKFLTEWEGFREQQAQEYKRQITELTKLNMTPRFLPKP